jgi:hypothetical protein
MNKLLIILFLTLNISVFATPQVIFDHNGGFYINSFELKMNVPDDSYTIVYTIDGSNPQTSLSVKNGGKTVSLTIDPKSNIDRPKTPCYIVRASLKKDSVLFPLTQTYVFLNEVINQTKPEGGFPTTSMVNDQLIYLGLNPKINNSDLINALKAIPSISIVTDLKNLFDPKTGIYVNAENGFNDGDIIQYDSEKWERFCSVELLNPNGETGFNVNCGLSIRGGWSRHGVNPWCIGYPKHGFHLEFKSKYGVGKLKYSLFDDEGVNKFDKIDLRCDQNHSWNQGDPLSTYNRDVFSRDTQRDMGRPYTRSRYYHLYLNGMYWGLYQTQERVDDHYTKSYFGGDESDYDVIKANEEILAVKFSVSAKYGSFDSWQHIYNMCNEGFKNNANYFAIEGKDENGKTNDSEVLVDVDNLIDYMLIIFYTGNYDAPSTTSRDNQPNNFYAVDNRIDKAKGFVFFNHDGESTLDDVNKNRVEIDMNIGGEPPTVTDFHPQWLHYKLSSNSEYRMRIADRIYKTFFNDGVFTPDVAMDRFQKRINEIEIAIIGESARWGDTRGTTFTKDDWKNQINDLYNNYFPYRTDIVLQQLIDAGLYPTIDPPKILLNNKKVNNNVYNQIYLVGMIGDIYYTTDNSDPRMIGGQINPLAKKAINNEIIELVGTTHIKARIKHNDEWSALNEVDVFNNVGVNVVKNEISIKIYPNPTNDYIHFDNITDKDNVVIYNIEGQKVFNGKVNGSLNLNNLNIKHGLYLLKVKNSVFKIMFN